MRERIPFHFTHTQLHMSRHKFPTVEHAVHYAAICDVEGTLVGFGLNETDREVKLRELTLDIAEQVFKGTIILLTHRDGEIRFYTSDDEDKLVPIVSAARADGFDIYFDHLGLKRKWIEDRKDHYVRSI